MSKFKKWGFVIFILFLLLNYSGSMAQKSDADIKKNLEDIEKKINALNESLKSIKDQYIDLKTEKRIEEIAEKIYLKKYKNSDDYLKLAQWIVLVLFGIFPIIIWVLSYYVVKNWKRQLNHIKNASGKGLNDLEKKNKECDEVIKLLSEKLNNIEKEVNRKIKITQAAAYYDIAVSSLNKQRYDLALELLLELYSSNYRLRDVYYHIGVCYKNLKEPDYPRALEFFGKAREAAINDGKEGMVATIQREIDATSALTKTTLVSG